MQQRHYQTLLSSAVPGTEVHILNPVQNAVDQITEVLAERQGIESIHIVSHGAIGSIAFSGEQLTLSNLESYANQLRSWSSALTDDADILLYGCNVAQGDLGQEFLHLLSQLTSADVAASDDLTGSANLGGNWILESATGEIESPIVFQLNSLAAYKFILPIGPDDAGYTADSTAFQAGLDLVPGAPGVVSIAALSNRDDTFAAIDLGANTFRFYGQTYTGNNQLFVSTNGLITFGSGTTAFSNTNLTLGPVQAAIAVAWDNWLTNVNGTPDDLVLYQFQDLNNDGSPEQFVIEWNNVHSDAAPASGDVTFQAILQLNTGLTNGSIILNYPDLALSDLSTTEAGSATVGIKATGTQGTNRLLISQNTSASPLIGTGKAVLITGSPPSLDLNGPAAGINYSATFTQNGGVIAIVDSVNLTVTDADSATLASATIALTNRPDGILEILGANTTGTNLTASYNSATGILTLSGIGTPNEYQQVLRTVTYNNTAANLTAADRTITFVVNDGVLNSAVAITSLVVNLTNPSPTAGSTPASSQLFEPGYLPWSNSLPVLEVFRVIPSTLVSGGVGGQQRSPMKPIREKR
jgi:hypothetical protein